MTIFRFLDLPLELRREVYSHHLHFSSHLPPDEAHLHTCREIPLMRVSKQINGEILDMLKCTTTFHFVINWQGVTLNGLILTDITSHLTRLDCDRIPEMRIQIYPPHPGRPMDMIHIWRHTQKLCNEFSRLPHLQHVSIEFIENEIARWSDKDGRPQDILCQCFNNSDVTSILDLFSFLTNASAATIHVPPSLIKNQMTQKWSEFTEDSLTSNKQFDEEDRRETLSFVEEDIKNVEPELKKTTGQNSKRELDRIQSRSPKLSEWHMSYHRQIWPYSECLSEEDCPGVADYDTEEDCPGVADYDTEEE